MKRHHIAGIAIVGVLVLSASVYWLRCHHTSTASLDGQGERSLASSPKGGIIAKKTKQLGNKKLHVVVFYVDGLIRSVLEDMALHGDTLTKYEYPDEVLAARGLKGTDKSLRLNNIRTYFMEQGTQYTNAFTMFPSLTVPANASMWTGVDSDRHSIKSQGQIDRSLLQEYVRPDTRYERLFHTRKRPSFEDMAKVRYNILSPHKTHKEITAAGVPTIYEFMEGAYISGNPGIANEHSIIVPSLPIMPATATSEIMSATSNYGEIGAGMDLDRVNFVALDKAYRDNRSNYANLTVMWLPMVDHHGHGEPVEELEALKLTPYAGQGQYGPSLRMRIKEVDWIIGKVMEDFRKNGWFKDTIFVLTADHGHMGGRPYRNPTAPVMINQRWAIGPWLSEHLVTNVLMPAWIFTNEKPNFYARNPLAPEYQIMGVDNEAYGVSKIYLPYKATFVDPDKKDPDQGYWTQRNTLKNLREYKIRNGKGEVLTFDVLAAVLQGPNKNEISTDFAIVPRYDLTKSLKCGNSDAQILSLFKALPSTREGQLGMLESTIIHCLDSERSYYETKTGDVLGFKKVPANPSLPGFNLSEGHTFDEWLEFTKNSEYPDAIHNFIRDVFNRPNVVANAKYREMKESPDIILSAAEGWNYRKEEIPCTDHGYALYGSTNVPMMFFGTGIPKGKVVDRAVRTTDLTPTILKLLELEVNNWNWFDGKPLDEVVSTSR